MPERTHRQQATVTTMIDIAERMATQTKLGVSRSDSGWRLGLASAFVRAPKEPLWTLSRLRLMCLLDALGVRG